MPDEPRAEVVGSLLRGEAVLRAVRRGSLADQTVINDAVRDNIRLQEEAGVDVITDGEARRLGWVDTPRLLDCFAVYEGRGALNWRGGAPVPSSNASGAPGGTGPGGVGRQGAGGGYPTVVRRVTGAQRHGDPIDGYEFLARHARTRTKFTLPAPSYHRRYWSAEHSTAVYDSPEEYLTEIRDWLRESVDRLLTLGCDYVQLDAPNYGSLCDPDTRARMAAEGRDADAELAFDVDLDNSLFDGIKGVTTALHICRGNGPRGMWHSAGGYAAISGAMFPKLRFGRLLLEYDSDRAGDFGPLDDVADGTTVVLGLLTTKSDDPDDADAVRQRITEAARRKPLEELALSTQCGFASAPPANPVSPEGQRAKLEMVARIARRVWN
ncbi:MAG: cobalamin-independent methionine synthase II family protein [Streptosporangiales bacterium]|nr:cobalamin-independent methionine synthase II family protein [Streptosporangiales bacterium]